MNCTRATTGWHSVFYQLKEYDKCNTLASEVDEKYCEGFIDFLRSQGIHNNTIFVIYFVYICCGLFLLTLGAFVLLWFGNICCCLFIFVVNLMQ